MIIDHSYPKSFAVNSYRPGFTATTMPEDSSVRTLNCSIINCSNRSHFSLAIVDHKTLAKKISTIILPLVATKYEL